MKGIGQRDGRGMTTLGLGGTLAVLVLLGLGGWTAYCYYDLLDRETELAQLSPAASSVTTMSGRQTRSLRTIVSTSCSKP